MSFVRTNSGISNLRLFYDAELVIFTEGGDQSFSPCEISDGKCNKQSVDVKFWRNILKQNGFGKKVEFRPIGSKTTSKYLCEKIVNGEVSNVVVAMDRDLDSQIGYIFNSPFILYTKGYSWENDVFTRDLTSQQIESMLFMAEIPDEIYSIVDKAYGDLKRVGKHLLKFEVIFREHGIKFISDLNGERFFNSKRSPFLDKAQVLLILQEKKKLISRPANMNANTYGLCPLLNNYGKLIQALSINVISYICRKFGKSKSIPKDIVVSSMIERYSNKLKESTDEYYSGIVSELQNNI